MERNEAITCGFCIVQYAKLRMFQFYCNFFHFLFDVNKLEELEMDTDSQYLALAEKKELENCIQPEMNKNERVCSQRTPMIFSRLLKADFFSWTCCVIEKKQDRWENWPYQGRVQFYRYVMFV